MTPPKKSSSRKSQPPAPAKSLPQGGAGPANGILVQVSPGGEDGNQRIVVVPVGDTRLTEAPVLLEHGRRIALQQLGL
jgi:hypothetical protein